MFEELDVFYCKSVKSGGVQVWEFCHHVAGQVHNQARDPNPPPNQVRSASTIFPLLLYEHFPRSYRGHHDANFNVAILDGHKEIVAHEKFQQLLHKKWGQRDKIHYGDDIRCLVTLSPGTFAVSQASIFDLTTPSYVDVEYSQVQHLLERDEQGAEVGSCDKTGKPPF